MITRNDVLDVLTKAAAYDAAHTPKTSNMLIHAWLEHFESYAPNVQREELIAAVTEYHREPRDRMLQPADLSALCRALRRDALDRMEPDEAPQHNKSADIPDYPADWTREQRLCAYWHTVRTGTKPATTENWHTVLAAAKKNAPTSDPEPAR
jgi:hypothetical protein